MLLRGHGKLNHEAGNRGYTTRAPAGASLTDMTIHCIMSRQARRPAGCATCCVRERRGPELREKVELVDARQAARADDSAVEA